MSSVCHLCGVEGCCQTLLPRAEKAEAKILELTKRIEALEQNSDCVACNGIGESTHPYDDGFCSICFGWGKKARGE